jgi:hypothetical protein
VDAPPSEEALSDDGTLTGRGHPWLRGSICGAMTALGGLGHTLPFLIPAFRVAMIVAFGVVLVELATITWIRHRSLHGHSYSVGSIAGRPARPPGFITGLLIGSW